MFPVVLIIPLVLKLICAFIFSNIEFKTQTYRYLKLNSIINAMLMLTLLFLPLTECNKLCDGWWESNYWLLAYKLYIIRFISRCMRTISSLIILTISWNQFRDLNDCRIRKKNRFYLIVIFSITFSFVLYLPDLFLNKIEKEPSNDSVDHLEKDTTDTLKGYVVEAVNIFQYAVAFIILIFTLFFNIIVACKIKYQKNTEFKSILFISTKKKNINSNPRNSISVQFDAAQIISQKMMPKLYESQTKLLSVFITFAFTVDEVLTNASDGIFSFGIKNEMQYFVFIRVFYLMVFVVQMSHVFVFYKFNKAFSRRFKKIFKVCHYDRNFVARANIHRNPELRIVRNKQFSMKWV